MVQKRSIKIILLLILAIVAFFLVIYSFSSLSKNKIKVVQLSSEEDFRTYIDRSREVRNELIYNLSEDYYIIFRNYVPTPLEAASALNLSLKMDRSINLFESSAKRYPLTNVQVSGIDTSDIIKNDEKTIYYSDAENLKGTVIINAFPIQELKSLSKINESGYLLVSEDRLIIFDLHNIYGYDISDRRNPKKIWEYKVTNITFFTAILDAKLYNNKIYLITLTIINEKESITCPLKILYNLNKNVILECNEIYRFKDEELKTSVNLFETLTTILVIEPKSGEIINKKAIIGSIPSSWYMSKQYIYLSFVTFNNLNIYIESFLAKFKKFIIKNYADYASVSIIKDLIELMQSNKSSSVKFKEIGRVINDYLSYLKRSPRTGVKLDQKKSTEEIMEEILDFIKYSMNDYEIYKTKLLKFDLDLNPISAAEIQGVITEPSFMDEYKEYLRVAAKTFTIPLDRLLYRDFKSILRNMDHKDIIYIFVLDRELDVVGSMSLFLLGERVYGVRFIYDLGYIATYGEVSPLSIVDLSDPKNPKMEGKLEISEYFSYSYFNCLHPIDNKLLIGIGIEDVEEENDGIIRKRITKRLKISLFDVSSAKSPKELDKYILEGNYLLINHRAFLIDPKRKIIFLPRKERGYIFSYENNKLSLVKIIDICPADRALYINDHLFIICKNQILAIDRNTWTIVNQLNL